MLGERDYIHKGLRSRFNGAVLPQAVQGKTFAPTESISATKLSYKQINSSP